jgi:hypothetical protein
MAGDVREFRVNVADTRWGEPRFTYTPRVRYQHKVYDFVIPLSEFGDARSLDLAFAAYGTAAPCPSVVYDPDRFRYFAVFGVWDGAGQEIHGQLVRPDGVPVGDPVGVATDPSDWNQWPDVAYDPVSQRYLVVWQPGGDVYGRLISADGMTFLTDPFAICDAAGTQTQPRVAFDDANRQYLVVWADDRAGPVDIYGRMVAADGTPDAELCFPICENADFQYSPDVASDTAAGEFLVVWEDDRAAGFDLHVYAQIVKADKSLGLASDLVVVSEANSQEASVAFDPVSGQYLVTWTDYRLGGETEIRGRLIASGGTPVGVDFPLVQAGSAYMYWPRVAYSPSTGGYICVWEDDSGAYRSLYGQEIAADGSVVLGDEFDIVVEAWHCDYPVVAANTYTESALMVYRSDAANPDPWFMDYALVGEDYPLALYDKTSHDFGSLHTGETSAVAGFEFTNPSGADLVIATVTLTGDDADQFVIQTDVSSTVAVEWASTWTFEVLFAPTTAGAKTASVELASDDPSDDPVVLDLTGEGTNTAPEIPALAFPQDGLTNVSATEVTFIWGDVTDADGDTPNHFLYLATTDDFEDATPIEVAAAAPSALLLAGASLALLLAAMGRVRSPRKRAAVLLLVVACAVFFGLAACRSTGPDGGGTDPVENPEPEEGQRSYTVSDLLAATTYYWKVIVDDGYGGVAESEVRSFTTQ